jgi:hypothetical protein
MDVRRRAFLEALEADLSSPAQVTTPDSPARRAGKVSAFAATLLASAAFFAGSAGAAGASPAGANGVLGCMDPDFKNYTHTKNCSGLDIQRFTYLRTYSPNQAVVCHVFHHESFTCNSWYHAGYPEACSI